MSWLDVYEADLVVLSLAYPPVDWFAKRGFWKVDALCQDGKVALTSGVNQTILLDLETGEWENLRIAA